MLYGWILDAAKPQGWVVKSSAGSLLPRPRIRREVLHVGHVLRRADQQKAHLVSVIADHAGSFPTGPKYLYISRMSGLHIMNTDYDLGTLNPKPLL